MVLLLFYFVHVNDSTFTQINLEKFGMFQYNAMSFHKLRDGYLISSDFDNVVCRVNTQGELVAKYDLAGPGPNELHHQVVMHADHDEILVVTNHRHIIRFNGLLEPQEEAYPPLPHSIWGGAKLGPDHFLVLSARSTSFALKEFRLEENDWRTRKRSFAIEADPNTMVNTRFFRYDDHLGFFFDAAIDDKPDYLIEVHDLRENRSENIVQMLAAPIDTLPGRDHAKVFLSSALSYGDGYLAFLVVRTYPKYEFKAAWIDRFNHEGQFIKRYPMDKYTGIIPVQNSREVLEINQDTMLVRRLQLDP